MLFTNWIIKWEICGLHPDFVVEKIFHLDEGETDLSWLFIRVICLHAVNTFPL